MIMSVNFQQMPFMAILMKMIGSNTFGKTFDYIVFADVLEHLMNPQSALAKVKPF